MRPIVKTLGAVGLAGALALSATAPSAADDRWGYAAGGFALGAITGAAIASANRPYYGSPYNYYAYEPTYAAPAYTYSAPAYVDTYAYAPAPAYDSYAYAPGPVYVAPRFRYRNCYNYNDCLSNRERQLQGTD